MSRPHGMRGRPSANTKESGRASEEVQAKRVLLVGNEPEIFALLARLLPCSGYEVDVASSGYHAWEMIWKSRLTRYVQSTFKVKTPQRIIWIDPFMVNAEHIGDDKADLILVTHEHGDHFSVDAINAACKEGTELICSNSGIISKLQGNVSAKVFVMKEGDASDTAGVHVRAMAGYNDIHPRNQGHNSFNVGFIFTLGGAQVLHTGDTGLIDEFERFGSLDIAMLPIGGTYTMDEAEAARAITQLLKPRIAIPMHYGFATAGDPNRFKELVGAAAQVEIVDAVLPGRMG